MHARGAELLQAEGALVGGVVDDVDGVVGRVDAEQARVEELVEKIDEELGDAVFSRKGAY